MLRLFAFAIAAALLARVSVALKMPNLEPPCNKGSSYVNAPRYGVSSSQWGHLPRGGWRGAVLGPHGDKIYGIPTNATSVRARALRTAPAHAQRNTSQNPLTHVRHARRCSRSTR